MKFHLSARYTSQANSIKVIKKQTAQHDVRTYFGDLLKAQLL